MLSVLFAAKQNINLVTNLLVCHNPAMRLSGRILNGKVVLDGHVPLPEGAEVVVEVRDSAPREFGAGKVQFPLFHSKNPGSLDLSNQRIAEILEDEELSAGH